MKLLHLLSLVAFIGTLSFAKPIAAEGKTDIVVDKRAPKPVAAVQAEEGVVEKRGGRKEKSALVFLFLDPTLADYYSHPFSSIPLSPVVFFLSRL
jgi:hypothetical protein